MPDLPPSLCGRWTFTFAQGVDPAETGQHAVQVEADGTGTLVRPSGEVPLEVTADDGPGRERVRLGWAEPGGRGHGHLELKNEGAARGTLEAPGRPAMKFTATRAPEPTPAWEESALERLAMAEREALDGGDWNAAELAGFRKALFDEQNATVQGISKETLISAAREMGLSRGNRLNLRTEDEMSILMDHAIYDRPLVGPCTVQVRLRQIPPATDPAVAAVRRAMAVAAHTLLRIENSEPGHGVVVRDLLADRRIPLADRGLSSIPVGQHMAGRLLPFDDYALLTGAGFPVPADLAERLVKGFLETRADGAKTGHLPQAEVRRSFATAVIRIGFDKKLTTRIRYEHAD